MKPFSYQMIETCGYSVLTITESPLLLQRTLLNAIYPPSQSETFISRNVRWNIKKVAILTYSRTHFTTVDIFFELEPLLKIQPTTSTTFHWNTATATRLNILLSNPMYFKKINLRNTKIKMGPKKINLKNTKMLEIPKIIKELLWLMKQNSLSPKIVSLLLRQTSRKRMFLTKKGRQAILIVAFLYCYLISMMVQFRGLTDQTFWLILIDSSGWCYLIKW